jgi:hypothetical protein
MYGIQETSYIRGCNPYFDIKSTYKYSRWQNLVQLTRAALAQGMASNLDSKPGDELKWKMMNEKNHDRIVVVSSDMNATEIFGQNT